MKRLCCIALALALALPLGGCMQPVQLDERAIVQGIGVDYENGLYRLTLLLYDPQSSGEKEMEQTDAPLVECVGKSIAEALEQGRFAQGKEIFWGQNQLVVIGSGAAQNGIAELLEFFSSSHQARADVETVTALGSAGELLAARLKQQTPTKTLKEILKTGQRNGRLPRARIMDLAGAPQNAGFCTPLAARAKEPDGTDSVAVTGLALYREGRLTGTADLEAARGVLWLRGEAGPTELAVEAGGERRTLTVNKVRTRITPRLEDGLPHFTVDCVFTADLNGAAGENLPALAREAEQACALLIQREIGVAVEQTLRKNGAEVMGLALLLRKYEPAWYAQNSADYGRLAQGFSFTVRVTPSVPRWGPRG